jgi:hypothetical protein
LRAPTVQRTGIHVNGFRRANLATGAAPARAVSPESASANASGSGGSWAVLPYSLAMTALAGVIALLQVYVFPCVIPLIKYTKGDDVTCNSDRTISESASGIRHIGAWAQISSPRDRLIMGNTGFDVIIDLEHGSLYFETAVQMIRAAEVSGITLIVRARTRLRASSCNA